MAKWQVMKGDLPTNDPHFDDGNQAAPGEDSFSTDAVKAHVVSLGAAADGWNYVGMSDPPAE